jgi:hypothetical protein
MNLFRTTISNALKQYLARLLRRRPPAPGPETDPYAGVREPRKRGPADRSAAVALSEPDD